MTRDRIPVLVAAGGAGWEATALRELAAFPRIVLLRRCVDLPDVLASATTGQASVAIVAVALPGLDADSIGLLARSGVRVVLVAEPLELSDEGERRFSRLGADRVVETTSLGELAGVVAAAAAGSAGAEPAKTSGANKLPAATRGGAVLGVWGPTGAPGRTTVAVGIAAELAHRGVRSLLVDGDGFGGAVAQHLGILDEASGLLAAARAANSGRLDEGRLASLARQVDPGLRVLTGLPRADRWAEVREPALARILDVAVGLADYVVVDLGFCLEQDADAVPLAAPRRHAITLTTLERADEVVVVGSADPVGLARLARGLVDLLELVPAATLRVVVNRNRPSLGWGERDVRAMVEGFVMPASLHFLPEDRPAADRAVVTGKTLVELEDSALRRGLSDLAGAIAGKASTGRRRRLLRRRR